MTQAQDELVGEAQMKAEMALIDGQRYLILENYAKSLEMFQVAREINPNDAAIHFKIAEVMFRSQQTDEAVESIEKAIELEPDNKFYYLLAADIHTAQGNLDLAEEAYEELVKRPDNEDYLVELALIYQYQGKLDNALEMYSRAQDHFGTNEALVIEKEKILRRLGNQDGILAEWKRLGSLLEYHPWKHEPIVTRILLLAF